MKLLLHADVPKLGFFGDVVEVADGYGRNYLVPQRLAVIPTDANVKAIEMERAARAEERRLVRVALEKVANKVAQAEVSITGNANEQGHLYGSVAEVDISKALQELGHEIKASQVVLSEHIRAIGGYEVELKFAADLSVKVKVNVVSPEAQDGQAQPEENVSEQDDE